MSLNLKSNVHQIKLISAKSPVSRIYEFEDFRLDVENLMLYCGLEELSLTPKQVETLLALVEAKGQIISKEALMDRLWKDAAVEESNLVQNIYILRKTLGETSDGRPMIETFRRRGYRFNAKIKNRPSLSKNGNGIVGMETADQSRAEYLTTASGSHHLVSGEIAAVPKTKLSFFNKRNVLAVLVGTVVITVVAISVFFVGIRKPIAGSGGKRKVAVLPLTPIDFTNRDDLYEIGVADALINRLSTIQGFEVRPLSSTRGYDSIQQDSVKAGREQNVDFVLAPNYQLADGKIRITYQWINVATGEVEDTYTFEKEASNHFAIQDAAAADLANKLMARFGAKSIGTPVKRGTNSEEAYRNYQQAMTLVDQQRPGSMQKANEYLDRAIELDPNYARAWAGKANANSVAWYSNRDSDNEKLYQVAMDSAKKAIALDPNNSEAYTSLCDSKFFYELNADEAETACKRATELDPSSSLAHMTYTMLLSSRGRFDQAFSEINTAMDLDPVSLRNQRTFANTLYQARRYDEAIKVYRRLVDLNPDTGMTYLWYIRALEQSGRESEAFENLIKLMTLRKKDNETIERFKTAYASAGWAGAIKERINTELNEQNPNYGHLAEYYGKLGEKDEAFKYMEKSREKRAWQMMFLPVDPRFDPLRDDPRFDALVRRVEGN